MSQHAPLPASGPGVSVIMHGLPPPLPSPLLPGTLSAPSALPPFAVQSTPSSSSTIGGGTPVSAPVPPPAPTHAPTHAPVRRRRGEPSDSAPRRKQCNCKNSRCLKLYCECFANGQYCNDCNCRGCCNTTAHESLRRDAIEAVLERNPNAFKPKIATSPLPLSKLGKVKPIAIAAARGRAGPNDVLMRPRFVLIITAWTQPDGVCAASASQGMQLQKISLPEGLCSCETERLPRHLLLHR